MQIPASRAASKTLDPSGVWIVAPSTVIVAILAMDAPSDSTYRISGTRFCANTALLTQRLVHPVLVIVDDRSMRTGIDALTALRTYIRIDRIPHQRLAHAGRASPVLDVSLVLVREIPQRGQDGVRRRLAQRAERARRDGPREILESIE